MKTQHSHNKIWEKKGGKWKEVKAGDEYRVKGREGGIEDGIMTGSSHWEDERGGHVGLDQEQLEKIAMTETDVENKLMVTRGKGGEEESLGLT